jgi:hypothetical protein
VDSDVDSGVDSGVDLIAVILSEAKNQQQQ